MAVRTEFTFPSSEGRTTIHVFEWKPDSGEPRAILQIAHGMQEYILRYDEFARFLTDHGFVVVGNDHLGHGASVQTSSEWGYFCEENPSDVLIGDMQTVRMTVRKEYPDLPFFILGHSMGSYLLRKYLYYHGEGISGAIVMGTGYVPEKTTKLGLRIVRILTKMHGSKYRSRLVESMAFGGAFKQFDRSGKNPANSWLSKNVESVKRYYQDPRCTTRFTLNGYRCLFETIAFTCRQMNVDELPKDLPVLITSGADDPVGDFGKGTDIVRDMFEKAWIQDLTYKLYPGDRHEILNELDRETVYQDLLNWMEARFDKESGREGADAAGR